MTNEQQTDTNYLPYNLWTSSKPIRELRKITSFVKKGFKPWLAEKTLWLVQTKEIKGPHYKMTKLNEQHQFSLFYVQTKEIKRPHYKMTKPNEQHQFNLFYVPHNAFEGNT